MRASERKSLEGQSSLWSSGQWGREGEGDLFPVLVLLGAADPTGAGVGAVQPKPESLALDAESFLTYKVKITHPWRGSGNIFIDYL